MATQTPFNKIHFLTETQYQQETISQNDIYAVAMPSISPGEIVLKAFQNGIEVQLTAAQAAAARAWFGVPVLGAVDSNTHINSDGELVADPIGVVINSSDPTVSEATMMDAELMDVVTSITESASNAQIPTAKAVRDYINGNHYHTYTVIIDTTNSNPETSVTYANDAVSIAPGSPVWDTIFGAKPCVFANGAVVGYLNPNDYTKYEDGTAAPITTVGNDVMVEFPRMGLSISNSGGKIYINLTDDPGAPGYSYAAFSRDAEGDRDKFYYGAYKGYVESSQMYSVSGKTPSNNFTRATGRSYATARGTGYYNNGWHQLIYLQCLYILKYKNLDSQTALGQGYTASSLSGTTTTGGTNTKGFNYGEQTGTVQMKFLGIEDFWGNIWQWVDGITSDSNRDLIITTLPKYFDDAQTADSSKGQKKITTGVISNISGYMKTRMGDQDGGFVGTTTGGSATTYWCDYGSLYASCAAFFGGRYTIGAYAGAFDLRLSGAASYLSADVGDRIMYV